jgi:hypothetical protein
MRGVGLVGGTMTKPRAYTVEEMREMFVDHLHTLAKYWAKVPLGPEFDKYIAEKGDVLYRLEGLLFSFLVTLDGGSGGMPAFDVRAAVSAEDRAFHREEEENWWGSQVFNDCQLHDIFSGRK